ncbi:MAG TPA: formylglycine-generating enzyme family protein [Myxococcaceae bacterium]|nr:formylglycine-generating enzyme family protein [Myxococcaceae bacterium]
MRRARGTAAVLVLLAARMAGADEAFPGAPEPLPCLEVAPAGMACIPGGAFLRGVDGGKHAPARPQATVWVQTFYMDTHEVTYGAYKACIQAGRCRKAGPTYRDFDNPQQPINGVSWYDAKAYCEAHGKHLPTEAQWEKAARGTDGRLYPWGDAPATCERAVIMDARGRSCGQKQRSKTHADVGRPEPVGSRPPNPYGLHDMSGNAWEWVADWFTPSWKVCGEACLGVEPKGPCEGREPCAGHTDKVVRGGSWFWPASYATTVYRRPHVPANRPVFHHFGFRCAASVEAARALPARSP